MFDQGGQHLENPGKTWKSLEYAIGTWKTWKIGRIAKNLEKAGISEIIPGKTNEFACKKAIHEVFFFSFILATLATCNFFSHLFLLLLLQHLDC